MLNSYFIVSAVHLSGVLAFQYTGNEYWLFPGVALICWSMINFINAVGTILSPGEIEIEFDDVPSRLKLVQQLGAAITAYMMYTVGYQLFAGAAYFMILVTVWAILKTWAYFYGEENEEE